MTLVHATASAPGPIWQATLRESGSEKRKGMSGNNPLSSSTKIFASSSFAVCATEIVISPFSAKFLNRACKSFWTAFFIVSFAFVRLLAKANLSNFSPCIWSTGLIFKIDPIGRGGRGDSAAFFEILHGVERDIDRGIEAGLFQIFLDFSARFALFQQF